MVFVTGMIETRNKNRTADDVAKIDEDEIFQEVHPSGVAFKNRTGDDKTVGHTMLKTDGNEDHDRKPDAQNLAGAIFGTVAQP